MLIRHLKNISIVMTQLAGLPRDNRHVTSKYVSRELTYLKTTQGINGSQRYKFKTHKIK